MAVSLSTLIQLLQDLYEELKTCLERENPPSIKEPIVLGEFIVEAYNRYLRQAKELCADPMVQSMPELVPAGSPPEDEEGGVREAGPRLQQMGEVSLATRSLLTALRAAAKQGTPGEPNEVPAAISLLSSLEVALEHNTIWTPESTNALVDQYNRCLEILEGAVEDPVLTAVFPRLDYVTGGTTDHQARLSELRIAHRALRDYLIRRRGAGRLAYPPPETDGTGDSSASA
jgi:hypothetical protein